MGDQTVFGTLLNGRMPNQGMGKSSLCKGELFLEATFFRIPIFSKALHGQQRVLIVNNPVLSIIPPAMGLPHEIERLSIDPRFKEPQFVEFRILQ